MTQLTGATSQTRPGFHWGYTEAEMALLDALDIAQSNGELMDYEEGRPDLLTVTSCVLTVLVDQGLVSPPSAALTVVGGRG